MDLWDVAKLLWRRLWLTLPLILVTVSVASYFALTMQPDYKAIGNVILLAPTQAKPEPTKGVSTTVSPWNVWSVSDALVIYLARADIKEEFVAAGLSQEWTASVAGTQLPIVQVEVVAPSETAATAALTRLVNVLTTRLVDMQSPYGVTGKEAITAQVLDVGQNNVAVTSKVKRAVIVALAVGLMLTAALVIWVDAMLRRRKSRAAARAESTGTALAPVLPPMVRAAPSAWPAARPVRLSSEPARAVTAVISQGPPADRVAHDVLVQPGVADGQQAEADSTIVLPLSSGRLSGKGRPSSSPDKS